MREPRGSPGHDAFGEFRPETIHAASLEGTGEERIEKVRPPAGNLALREWVKTRVSTRPASDSATLVG